jgi:hypothetical protein
MLDLRQTTTATFGDVNPFTSFDGKSSNLSRIDYIFGTHTGWKGGVYAVEENHFEDGMWLRDQITILWWQMSVLAQLHSNQQTKNSNNGIWK